MAYEDTNLTDAVSVIRRLEAAGKFPKRVQIGASRVGWVRAEVEAWIEARMGAR